MSFQSKGAGNIYRVSGHEVYCFTAKDEPERQFNQALADLSAALPDVSGFTEGSIEKIITTPDFHAGKPVPVGIVADVKHAMLPHLIGNDIGCGMRLIVLENIKDWQLTKALEGYLRHIFFQGGRNIALNGRNRAAILREGMPGLLESALRDRRGLLCNVDMARAWADCARQADDGFFPTTHIDPDFEAYVKDPDIFRHDAILGTIGGGNHFVEFCTVDQICDGAFAYAVGLKKDSIVLIVHSGSLDFGQRVGSVVGERLARRTGLVDHRPLERAHDKNLMCRYENAMANAANIALANRFFIGLGAIEALSKTIGRSINHHLIYDSAHNMIWKDGDVYRHRKGSCPARGIGQLSGSPYEWQGEPVILPGSMGDCSWLLKGLGNKETMSSSAHGAGRKLSRTEARRDAHIPKHLTVVGPINLNDPLVKARPDIVGEVEKRMQEEAPSAYRSVENVVVTMEDNQMASRVARFKPLLTVKG